MRASLSEGLVGTDLLVERAVFSPNRVVVFAQLGLVFCSVFSTIGLSAVEPTTSPTARARKTAMMETR